MSVHTWICPSCKMTIGSDYLKCSICGFVKALYEEEKSVSRQILSFIRSEEVNKRDCAIGKPRRNAYGFHKEDPYLYSHSSLRPSSTAYMNKFLKLKNS